MPEPETHVIYLTERELQKLLQITTKYRRQQCGRTERKPPTTKQEDRRYGELNLLEELEEKLFRTKIGV